MTILDVQGVTRSFGAVRAADDVSFQVSAGQICGFIGPNGAGKTTTMRICATLDLPDSGDVFIEGRSVLEDPRGARRSMGFMPDHYASEPNTPVIDYLDFHGRAQGLDSVQRKARIDNVVEFTGLGPLLDKECLGLSKGMRQRAGLAVTLLHDPALLILDEPAAGLDPRARVELRELLAVLADMGKAVLISSHILTELSEICDVVAVIEAGKIRASGKVADIQRQLNPDPTFFLRALTEPEVLERYLAEQPGVSRVRFERGGVVFGFSQDDEAQADLLARVVGAGLKPLELRPVDADLEEVFLSLTEGKVQ
jgi:ABC-2 type transport system ATP-binding protein